MADSKSNRAYAKEDVVRAMESASHARAEAASYTGQHGQAVKTFVENFGVERKAFTFARGLYDMDQEKQQSVIRDLLGLIQTLGMLDQKDLFDDLGARVAKIKLRAVPSSEEGDTAA